MFRLSRAILLCGSLLFAAACFAGNPQANVPGWVKDLAAVPVENYPPRTNAVVLLDETIHSVTGPGEYVQTTRRVVRILRPEGHNEGTFGVSFRGEDKVLNIRAWSIDAQGHEYELKDKDFAEHGSFTDEFYSDYRARVAEVPASAPGSLVAFECSLRKHLWIAQSRWFFQEDIPVKEARFTLELPSGWEYKIFWINTPSTEPANIGPNRFQWVKRDLPGIIPEKRRPALAALSGRMELTYYGPNGAMPLTDSWRSIGTWLNGLTADRRTPSPDIQKEAQQLTAGLSIFDAKVRAIASFLQSQIRYVAIEIGIGGHQPHYASDIFKHRYGDCKDKATLMSSMLQVAGIRSYYVLIHTQHGIARTDSPSALTFNHAILAIELPKDAPSYRSVVVAQDGRKLLIFDATDTYTPLGELRGGLQGNIGLLATENGGEAITLPILEPQSNVVTREGKFILNPDGTLSGDVVERRTGDHARFLRSDLKESTESERTKTLERYFGNFLNGVSIHETKIENLEQLNQELVIRYKVTSGKYAQTAGSLLLVRSRVMGEDGVALDWKDRKYPVELGAPTLIADVFEIQLPSGYAVDDVPMPAKIDVGFATYQSNVEIVGNTVRYKRQYVLKDPQVPLAKLPDLKRLQQEIGRDENASVVLTKN